LIASQEISDDDDEDDDKTLPFISVRNVEARSGKIVGVNAGP
jgi:hypothetical protein